MPLASPIPTSVWNPTLSSTCIADSDKCMEPDPIPTSRCPCHGRATHATTASAPAADVLPFPFFTRYPKLCLVTSDLILSSRVGRQLSRGWAPCSFVLICQLMLYNFFFVTLSWMIYVMPCLPISHMLWLILDLCIGILLLLVLSQLVIVTYNCMYKL
jgi:hypothetical protein